VVATVRTQLGGRAIRAVPAVEREPRGVAALRALAARTSAPDGAPARGHSRVVGARAEDRTEMAATARAGGASDRPARARPADGDDGWLSPLAPPGRGLILFAGKGGVGKTTCAAAVALALAGRPQAPRVLLLSTDPAHSLGDALAAELADEPRAVRGAPPSLRAREIDAPALFAARRRRYLETVDAVFEDLRGGSRFDPTYDRVVVEDLIDLAPPGIDELLGILTVPEALGRSCDVAVVDTAPTGHALRLLAMPEAALEWVHALMAILLKYRAVMGLGELGQDLLAVARDLRALRSLLTDPKRATVVAVTRPAELPRLETRRLLAALRALHVGVAAVLVNAVTPPGCARCRRATLAEARVVRALRRDVASQAVRGCAIIQAPAVAPPPRGAAALTAWRRAWASGTR
jgi:arsenite-transporting ATPase